MASKSIIEINVDDSKFKAFAANFAKYQEALKGTSKDWKNSNSEASKFTTDTEKLMQKLRKAQKDLNKDIADGNQQLKNTAKITGEIAANFASSALSIAKWLTLGAIGSGFGLGALAANATNTRKTASGYGVTSGELRAANVNYGNYMSPESVLSKIADVQNDLSRKQILSRLGGKEGQDAAQMLPELFKNAIKEFKTGGQTSQYAEAMGLTQIFDIQDLRRGAQATTETLNKVAETFKNDIALFTLSPADEDAISTFWNQLKRAGEAIEINLIKALQPVMPQLIELSKVITKAITDFIGSTEVRKALEDFTAYLASDKAKQDIQSFFDGLSRLGRGMVKIADVLGISGENKQPHDSAGNYDKSKLENYNPAWWNFYGKFDKNYQSALSQDRTHAIDYSGSMSNNSNRHNPGNLRMWGNAPTENGFAKFGSDEEGIKAMAAQLHLYQNRDHLNTINDIVSKYAPKSENDTAAYIADMVGKTGFKSDQSLDLNDTNNV